MADLSSITWTSGSTRSGTIAMTDERLFGFVMSTLYTSGEITFFASTASTGTYRQVIDQGTALTITMDSNAYNAIDADAGAIASCHYLQLESTVGQTNTHTFKVSRKY